MRIEMNGTDLELDTDGGALKVEVLKTGYDSASLAVISRYVEASETELGLTLRYGLADGEISFREAVSRANTKLDKLSLAQKLSACVEYRGKFTVPMLHPDNVYLNGDRLRVVHFGLQGILAPNAFDEAVFMQSLHAMVLQIFRPKLAFDQLFAGSQALRDKFSTAVQQTSTPEELFDLIDAQLKAEQTEIAATKVRVSKRRYSWYRVVGVAGIVVGLVAGVFAWRAETEKQLQTAVVAAQASFISNNYAGAMADLEHYPAAALPPSAKYVLAVSSINLDDLTATQKEAILNNVSQKSDDVTLNYWIAIGRGEFEQALDYAQNLGDDQLTLLAYTDLYQATKLDSKMPGEKKQERLDEYAKAIDELTAKLTGEGDEAAQE